MSHMEELEGMTSSSLAIMLLE